MELEKYIKKSKDLINDTYFYIQDALMKYHESLDNLKDSSWKYSKTLYEQEYQKIVDTYNQTTTKVIENCKALVQEQKNAYMKEVDEFYQSDGSKLDLNFMNLIKSEIPLTAKEVTGVIDKNKDNPTMLRVVYKYLFETNSHLPEQRRIVLDQEHNMDLNRLIEFLFELLPSSSTVVLDSGVLVGELAPAMDEELGRIYARNAR